MDFSLTVIFDCIICKLILHSFHIVVYRGVAGAEYPHWTIECERETGLL